ncbi:GNAT family N-acetyltransferase [Variovorax sp. JS1663]|uniref:GNAT family N-acetyltransferase n=1 Tax=Variovorax sp. JS1663 TaxID=1851577 RepID=UPI000B343A96|nr:GNAT family N-acetyltransferase [Variovorax sp. JS1663]OUM03413.1 acetyltransferase [Variovorax sp. JS1663]
MNVSIVPLAEPYFESLHRALDVVARERRFLAFLQAPPAELVFAFYRNVLEKGQCQFLAVAEGEVVGWCDILPVLGEARRHVGVLGIGLVAGARHQGVGRRLMEATIAKAWATGMTRIELIVRADNLNAKALYERLGFEMEGIRRKSFLIDGMYHDSYAMALLRDA